MAAVKPCKHGHTAGRDTQYHCLACKRDRMNEERAANPQKFRDRDRAIHAVHREKRNGYGRSRHASNPAIAMLRHARKRATQGGYPFAITLSDILVPAFCPLLGIKLKVSEGSRGPSPDSPSLDKIKPELGYVPGNVWVISHRANALKGDASVQELELLVANLKKKCASTDGVPWAIEPPKVETFPWR